MRNHIILYITMVLAIVLTSCHHTQEPVPPKPVDPVHRTVLVYMVARNTLGQPGDAYDKADLAEMELAVGQGVLCGGRLLVYHCGYSGNPTLFEITATGRDTIAVYDDTEQVNSSIMADRLYEVTTKARSVAPADEYGLVLWSHASGWLEDGIEQDDQWTGPSVRSFGQIGNKKMNVTTLARVLEEAGPWSFVYFDCCFMASVEVAYQMRRVAPVMVGSVTELPGPGAPYQFTLPFLMARDGADLESAAAITYETYAKGVLHPTFDYCAISVIRLDRIERLAEAARALYAENTVGIPFPMPQRFAWNTYYFDLADYVRLMAGEEQAAEVLDAINDVVPYAAALPRMGSIYIDKHCGLSTFILQTTDDALVKGYKRLDWYTDVASNLKDE